MIVGSETTAIKRMYFIFLLKNIHLLPGVVYRHTQEYILQGKLYIQKQSITYLTSLGKCMTEHELGEMTKTKIILWAKKDSKLWKIWWPIFWRNMARRRWSYTSGKYVTSNSFKYFLCNSFTSCRNVFTRIPKNAVVTSSETSMWISGKYMTL